MTPRKTVREEWQASCARGHLLHPAGEDGCAARAPQRSRSRRPLGVDCFSLYRLQQAGRGAGIGRLPPPGSSGGRRIVHACVCRCVCVRACACVFMHTCPSPAKDLTAKRKLCSLPRAPYPAASLTLPLLAKTRRP